MQMERTKCGKENWKKARTTGLIKPKQDQTYDKWTANQAIIVCAIGTKPNDSLSNWISFAPTGKTCAHRDHRNQNWCNRLLHLNICYIRLCENLISIEQSWFSWADWRIVWTSKFRNRIQHSDQIFMISSWFHSKCTR